MENWKVLTLVGGISRNSLNKTYFHAMEKQAPKELEFNLFDVSKLPFFSQDIENDPVDIVTEFKDLIRESDAILIVTPEYNHSYPGVLKNALDWGSRPYGQNLWDKKPMAITGASPGKTGTYGAQQHLRQVCAYLNMYGMGQPELYFQAKDAFTEGGDLRSEEIKSIVTKFLDSFKSHIEIFLEKDQQGSHFKSQGLEDSPMTH